MSLNIDMKMIRPLNSAGCLLIFERNSWTLLHSCNVVNPGKYSTRIPLVHHQLCPKLCIVMNPWTNPTCLPRQYLIVGSRSSFQGITQNIWEFINLLCARDWWLLHHQSKINVSMKNPPSKLYWLRRSHLIVRLSTFQICQTSVSMWDLFLKMSWNVNFLGNSFPWIHNACNVEGHQHSPYSRMFVAVLSCIFWGLAWHLSHSIIHPVQEWSGF